MQQPAGGIQPVSGSKTFPMKANVRKVVHQNNGMNNDNVKKNRYFVWSPPWHLYILLLANLLAFYLKYFLAFYLAYLLAYYLLNFLAFYLANILALYLAYLLACYLTFYLAFYLAYLQALCLAYLMAFYLAYLLAFYLTFYLPYFLAFYLAFEIQRCALTKTPGWCPAVRIELGRSQVEVHWCALSWEGPRLRSSGAHWARSQVEVQQCALSWEGPQLRSSSAHWAWKLAKSLSKSWQGGSAGGSWCGHGRGKTGEGRGGGGGGGEQLLIKSNNPHLAGGEKCDPLLSGVVGISRTGPARSFAAICEPWTPPASL